MWFEVLPSFFIMVGAMSAAQFLPGVINLAVFGNMYHRSMNSNEQLLQYLRDVRVTGRKPYTYTGLEALPDEK